AAMTLLNNRALAVIAREHPGLTEDEQRSQAAELLLDRMEEASRVVGARLHAWAQEAVEDLPEASLPIGGGPLNRGLAAASGISAMAQASGEAREWDDVSRGRRMLAPSAFMRSCYHNTALDYLAS